MNIHDIDLKLCDLWDPQENWDLKDLHILLLLMEARETAGIRPSSGRLLPL